MNQYLFHCSFSLSGDTETLQVCVVVVRSCGDEWDDQVSVCSKQINVISLSWEQWACSLQRPLLARPLLLSQHVSGSVLSLIARPGSGSRPSASIFVPLTHSFCCAEASEQEAAQFDPRILFVLLTLCLPAALLDTAITSASHRSSDTWTKMFPTPGQEEVHVEKVQIMKN